MEDTLVFVDEGFLSRLSKYLGEGFYIKFDKIKFVKELAKSQDLFVKHIFYAVAPPFQSEFLVKMKGRGKRGMINLKVNFLI